MITIHNRQEPQVKSRQINLIFWICACIALLVPSGCGDTEPAKEPPGRKKSVKTDVLERGAATLQTGNPLGRMNVYLVGFHPMKEAPSHQLEAHHFCNQVNEDFAQCVLFDGNTADANLTGIEYIISEKLFESLPDEEKQYWHPHNYEILSGQLMAPGLPVIAEMELMESKMNSYGKTWHVWSTRTAGQEGDRFPLGEALLAWSFNRDGEARPGLTEARDERMEMDTEETRRKRQKLIPMANPQSGADVLKGAFEGPTEPIEGVQDIRTADTTRKN